jgi:hypothetical protein
MTFISPPFNPDHKLLKGCIVYYDLSSVGISGSTAINLINPGTYNGTISGATLLGRDRFQNMNNSLVFNGSTNNIVPSTVISGAKSVFAWIYPVGGSANNYGVIMRNNGGGYHLLIIDNSDLEISFYVGEYIRWQHVITLNTWQLIGISLETINKAYNNGMSLGTPSQGTPNKTAFSGAINQIGRIDDSVAFKGGIGEVYIYDRAISASEAAMLYAITKHRHIIKR